MGKSKLKILNEILEENKNIKFFTKGFYGDMVEIKVYIACINKISKMVDTKTYKLELIFDDNQIVNMVAYIDKSTKVGDFVKVIGFFFEGYKTLKFYCKGVYRFIPNEKEVEEFNKTKDYGEILTIKLSEVELPFVYRKSENFIPISGIRDFYYIDKNQLENEIELID